LKDRVDTAWGEIKAGLVRAVSIGFRTLEYSRIEGGGLRFLETEVLELSLVTVPANQSATIQSIKHFDTQQRAASGKNSAALPGVSGLKTSQTKGNGKMLKTTEQLIRELEDERSQKAERMEEIVPDENGNFADEDTKKEYRVLVTEVKGLDEKISDQEGILMARKTAKPVDQRATEKRKPRVDPVIKEKQEPGIKFARYARCVGLAHKFKRDVVSVAEELYNERDPEVVSMIKAAGALTPAMTSANTSSLIGNEGGFADFVDYLRPKTIVGRFGAGGIPGLRNIPFRVPLISQSAKGTAYWTGEGKGKPVTKMGAGRTELAPLKIAVITAATMELLRDSSPSAERLIRDDLAAGIIEGIDVSFIDPSNAGASNIEPASITYDNAAMNVASGGGGAENVRHDVRAAITKFLAAGNSLTSGVWIMSAQQALALSMMVNDLGTREFPGIGVNGGTFYELPVITSEHVSGYVVLVSAQDIWLGDDGGISIDMSTEASLEMRAGDDEGPTLNIGSAPPVAASLVSLWQTNSVGFRAERTINWARRRAAAVSTITSVAWGMEVESPAS
jgi:HK97 family phage major capsid protein